MSDAVQAKIEKEVAKAIKAERARIAALVKELVATIKSAE